MSLKNNKTCSLLEQYLSYLTVVKGRSPLTALEYRIDTLLFFEYVKQSRGVPEDILAERDFSDVDINFIKSITVADMYGFITYCGNERNVTTATRARKIVSIRQFWKYLKNKAHLLDNNIAEELESPKLPKRMPKYLSLEESIRLLIEAERNPRDYCILTIFLNCALRLSELVNLSVADTQAESIKIVGKGDKQRQIFLNHVVKRAVSAWLEVRGGMNPQTDALFITKNGTRVTSRGVQDIVKKYLKKAGFDNRGFSTHKLRHTADQICFEHGLSVIDNPKPSRGHYGDWLGDNKKPSLREQLQQVIDAVLEGCFDNIDHTVLAGLVNTKIKDMKFIKLIYKFLKAGYMENWKYHKTY